MLRELAEQHQGLISSINTILIHENAQEFFKDKIDQETKHLITGKISDEISKDFRFHSGRLSVYKEILTEMQNARSTDG